MLIYKIGNQQVTQYELGWLAGVFDSDGHMGMYNYPNNKGHGANVHIGITNTNQTFLCKVLKICELLNVRLYTQEKTRSKKYWSTAWVVRTGKFTSIVRFLKPLIPMLTVKQERAELLIDFCNRRLELAHKFCGGNLQSASRKFPYDKDDYWYFDKFNSLNKRVTPTTIPIGSRTQESSKRRTQINRLICDDIV